MKFSAKNLRLRKAAKRYVQFYPKSVLNLSVPEIEISEKFKYTYGIHYFLNKNKND